MFHSVLVGLVEDHGLDFLVHDDANWHVTAMHLVWSKGHGSPWSLELTECIFVHVPGLIIADANKTPVVSGTWCIVAWLLNSDTTHHSYVILVITFHESRCLTTPHNSIFMTIFRILRIVIQIYKPFLPSTFMSLNEKVVVSTHAFQNFIIILIIISSTLAIEMFFHVI